jgi:DNA mismatch repair protein MutS2
MLEGKVIGIKKEKIDIITDGGKRYTVTLSGNLRKVSKPKAPKKKASGDTFINVKPLNFELNLIGLHVDEALDMLDQYVDKAVLTNKERIKVIHGFGTGALRRAVHEYLKKNKHVKSFKLGGEFDGGLGSTIVILK